VKVNVPEVMSFLTRNQMTIMDNVAMVKSLTPFTVKGGGNFTGFE